MKFFEELGSIVEDRWSSRNYNEELFPSIAAEALTELPPSEHVDPWETIRWLNTTTQLPIQYDVPGNFGDPPITLFVAPRFYIDIYFWLMERPVSISTVFPVRFKCS